MCSSQDQGCEEKQKHGWAHKTSRGTLTVSISQRLVIANDWPPTIHNILCFPVWSPACYPAIQVVTKKWAPVVKVADKRSCLFSGLTFGPGTEQIKDRLITESQLDLTANVQGDPSYVGMPGQTGSWINRALQCRVCTRTVELSGDLDRFTKILRRGQMTDVKWKQERFSW